MYGTLVTSTVALLIAVGLPSGPADAAVRACFVLAGGLFLPVPLAEGDWLVEVDLEHLAPEARGSLG